jgi:hypothetical protein
VYLEPGGEQWNTPLSSNMPWCCRGVESGIIIAWKNGIALGIVLLARHAGISFNVSAVHISRSATASTPR